MVNPMLMFGVAVFLSIIFVNFKVTSLKQKKNLFVPTFKGGHSKSKAALPVRKAKLLALLSPATLC